MNLSQATRFKLSHYPIPHVFACSRIAMLVSATLAGRVPVL